MLVGEISGKTQCIANECWTQVQVLGSGADLMMEKNAKSLNALSCRNHETMANVYQ